MKANTNEKALRGIRTFLQRRDMEIVEDGWAHGKDKIDFVVRDEDELVFVAATIRDNEGTGLGTETPDRKMFERIAAAYLAEHLDTPEGTVRFDIVTMLILGECKALLRHHRNALGVDSNDLG